MELYFKMKKFLCSIVLILMCTVTILSGCNLVQTNSNALSDAVCASVGEDISVTRRELVNYYVSVTNQGYSYEISDLLDELINQKLIIKEVKENLSTYVSALGEELEDGGTSLKDIKNKYYYNTAMQSVYDYLDNQILTNENAIRSARGLELIEDQDEDEAETDYDKEDLYESSVEVVINDSGSKQIVVKYDDQKVETSLIADYDYASVDHGDKEIRKLAYDRFIESLKRNEKGKNLDTNEQNVLNREIERVYKIYEEQQYLNFFQEKYNRTQYVLDNGAIVENYKQLVKQSYSQFALEGENSYSTYVKTMQDDASSVYYHPYSSKTDGKGFIKVAHILIKFTDDQLVGSNDDDTLSYKEILEINDVTERENALEQWKQQCAGKARYTLADEDADSSHLAGNEYGEYISYSSIYAEILEALAKCTSSQQKAEVFNDLVYKYSQDEGSINPSKFTYYSVSVDSSVEESWVTGFAETARELYGENGEGAFSLSAPLYVNNVTFDDDGSVTSGTYAGYHMIFVLDEYSNLCDINSIDSLGEDFAFTLLQTRLMLGVEEKSVYDKIYDSLSLNNYSTYRTNWLETKKDGLKIVFNKKAYQDLL